MKNKWEIKSYDYDNLPEEIDKNGLSNNGNGKEYANYLVLYKNGKVYACESDAMEPEDKVFFRDLSFIEDWVNLLIGEINET